MANTYEIKQVASEWDHGWFCFKCDSLHHWKEKAYVDVCTGRKYCEKCAKERDRRDLH